MSYVEALLANEGPFVLVKLKAVSDEGDITFSIVFGGGVDEEMAKQLLKFVGESIGDGESDELAE